MCLLHLINNIKLPIPKTDEEFVEEYYQSQKMFELKVNHLKALCDKYFWDCESSFILLHLLSVIYVNHNLGYIPAKNIISKTLKQYKISDSSLESISKIPNLTYIYLKYLPLNQFKEIPWATNCMGQWLIKIEDKLYGFDWNKGDTHGKFFDMTDVEELTDKFYNETILDVKLYTNDDALETQKWMEAIYSLNGNHLVIDQVWSIVSEFFSA